MSGFRTRRMNQLNLADLSSSNLIINSLPKGLVASLRNTPQNTTYHAEGSVFEHMVMVLDEVRKLPQFFELDDRQKKVLTWAALLHDIGKIKVTKKKLYDWSAKGHEAAGVPMAFPFLLNQSSLSLDEKQDVLSLVRLHYLPMQMFYNKAELDDYKLLATRIDLRLLGYFSWSDLHGRICRNQREVALLIKRFVEEVVPAVEEGLGTSDQIQTAYRQAGFQKKNALWAAVKGNNAVLLEKLIQSDPSAGTSQPAFTAVLPVGIGLTQDRSLKEMFPAHLPFQHELPASAEDSDHFRSNHLRTSKHFISVFGKAGKQLLVEGPWQHRAYYQELNDFIRTCGGAIHRIQVGERGQEMDIEIPRKALKPERAKRDAVSYLPHPWESHKLEWMELD